MADDLFRVFKSVRKLVREKTEDLLGNVTPLERVLREVADEESCAVSNSLLRNIAITTNDAYAYSTVAQVVWQGISSEFWQRIYKCLCLLEYMILLGPERCRQDCSDAQMTIRSLTQYRFHDGRREQGGGVRQKAENILKLINDTNYWNNAKQQAIQDSEKYSGGIENEPYISPLSHMNIHTRASNPFFTGPQAMPPMNFGVRDSGNPFTQPTNFGRGQSDSNYLHGNGSRITQSRVGGGNSFHGGGTPGARSYPGGDSFHGNADFRSGAATRGGIGLGLYDPGDDFATDDPFGAAPDLSHRPPNGQGAESSDPFKDSAMPSTAANIRSAAPSLLDDELFESSGVEMDRGGAQTATAKPVASGQPQTSLLPDLLE